MRDKNAVVNVIAINYARVRASHRRPWAEVTEGGLRDASVLRGVPACLPAAVFLATAAVRGGDGAWVRSIWPSAALYA